MHNLKATGMALPHLSSVVGLFYGIWLGIAVSNYPLPGWHMSVAVLLAPVILLIICCCVFLQNDFLSVHKAIIFVYAIYAVFIVFAMFTTVMSGCGLTEIRSLLILPVMPMATYFLCHQFAAKKWIYRGFFVILVMGCLYTIYTSFGDIRAQGMTTHPNSSAVVLALGFVFLLPLAFGAHNVLYKLFLLGVSLLMIWGVAVTASRTGLLTIGVAVFVMFLGSSSLRKWLIPLFVLLTVFFLASDFSYQKNRVIGAYEVLTTGKSDKPGAKNVTARLKANKAALEIFRENSLIGVGVGGIRKAQKTRTDYGIYTHSGYMSLIAETGMIGTAFFLFFLMLSWRLVRNAEKNTGNGLNVFGSINFFSLKNMNWLTAGYLALLCSAVTWDVFKEKIFWVWLSIAAAELADYARQKIQYQQAVKTGRSVMGVLSPVERSPRQV